MRPVITSAYMINFNKNKRNAESAFPGGFFMTRLIMLGTGCAMVTKCYNTCFALELDNGAYFLTDAGGGNTILRQLEEAKIDYQKLHHMFVTHGHTDHILGVIWVMRKIAALMNDGKYQGEFHLYGHDLVKSMLEEFTRLTLKKKDLAQIGTRILLHEIKDGETVDIAGLPLTAFDILSTKAKQFGYTLTLPGGLKFTCLGDEPFNEHCRPYAENSDWLLCEAFCQYQDRERFKPYEKNHVTVKEASELAQALHAKNLVLYHTEDKTIACRKANYTAEAKKYFSNPVYVPDDLDVLEIK